MSDVDAVAHDASAITTGALGLPACGLGGRGDVDPPDGGVIQIDDELMPWSGVEPSEPSGGAMAGSAHPVALSGIAGGDAARLRAAREGGRRLAAAAAAAAHAGEAVQADRAVPLSVVGTALPRPAIAAAVATFPAAAAVASAAAAAGSATAAASPVFSPAPATWPGAFRAAAGRVVGALESTWPELSARFCEQHAGSNPKAVRQLLDRSLLAARSLHSVAFLQEVRKALLTGSASDAQLRRVLGFPCAGGPPAAAAGSSQLLASLGALAARDAAPVASSSGALPCLSATAPSWQPLSQPLLGVGLAPSPALPAAAPAPALPTAAFPPSVRSALTNSAIAPSVAQSPALLAHSAPPPAAAARAGALAAPAIAPSARTVRRRKNRRDHRAAALLAASHRGSLTSRVPRAEGYVPPPCAAGGVAAAAGSSFSPASSTAPRGTVATTFSEGSADCGSAAAQYRREPPRLTCSAASAAMNDGEDQRPPRDPSAATVAAAAAHLAETAATRAAFKAAHPNTVIASCDPGCKDRIPWPSCSRTTAGST